MASFEDYDEFGNYIGADIDSDDEPDFSHQEAPGVHAPQQQPLEGYDEGRTDAGPGAALMEIDGARYSHQRHAQTHKVIL
jgi:116 kDa U5 small nuclear ribonucleoprotein component